MLPKLEQLETKDWALAREMVKTGAALRCCHVPRAYGGLGPTRCVLVVSENWRGRRPSARRSARTPTDDRPAVLFGSEAQKQEMHRLLSGEIMGTASETDRDPTRLARGRATRQADGSFTAERRENVITNPAANLFVIFAK